MVKRRVRNLKADRSYTIYFVNVFPHICAFIFWLLGRYYHSSVALTDGTLVIMGGTGTNSIPFNEVWTSLDLGATWSLVTTTAWPSGGEKLSCSTFNLLCLGILFD
jgi:hypothetical protein